MYVVKAARAAAVVAGEQPALGIKLQPENIPAALGKNLKLTRVGVVTPNHAALVVTARRVRRIDTGPDDTATYRAALRTVQPAIRPPCDAVGNRVRVLKTKPGQVHHRVAIRDVVGIAVGIKQQMRGVHHPDPVAAGQCRIGQAEFIGEHLVRVVTAVAIRVFVDGNTAAARRVVGRRLGLAVILGPIILVAADLPQPGRIRVLHIMRNPQPTTRIETKMCRLRHQRLVQNRLNGQAVGQFKSC